MKCHIVKDLLPHYIGGLNSGETNADVSMHLDACADCRSAYEGAAAEMSRKKKRTHRNMILAVCACIILLGGLLIFARTYEIPIPFDPHRMTVELAPVAVVCNADGSTSWWELSTIESPEGIVTDPDSDTVIPTEYEHVMEIARISYQGFSNISEYTTGRSVNRNGEDVRVVYYRYTKTPWISLFYDYDLTNTGSSGSSYGTAIYGDHFQSADYMPQRIEIYYLPISNLQAVEDFSDADYDAQRENAALVWSGVI